MGKASVKPLKQFIVLSLTWWVIFPEAGMLAKMPQIAFFLFLCRYIMIYSPYSYESCQTRHSLIYHEILCCITSYIEHMSHHFLDLNILLTALSFAFLFRTFFLPTKKCMCVCVCAHRRVCACTSYFLGLEDIGDQMSLNFSTYTFKKIYIYLTCIFGCIRSLLWHVVSSLCHSGSFSCSPCFSSFGTWA